MGLFDRLRGRRDPDAVPRSVDVAGARALLDAGAVLVDVRTPAEWKAGHAPAAVHVPLDRLGGAGRLPADAVLVTVCRSGARSARAAAQLRAEGRRVADLRGGMLAWQRAGERIVGQGRNGGTVA